MSIYSFTYATKISVSCLLPKIINDASNFFANSNLQNANNIREYHVSLNEEMILN